MQQIDGNINVCLVTNLITEISGHAFYEYDFAFHVPLIHLVQIDVQIHVTGLLLVFKNVRLPYS